MKSLAVRGVVAVTSLRTAILTLQSRLPHLIQNYYILILGDAMLTASLAPNFGEAMLTESLWPTFGEAMFTESLLLAAGLDSLLELSLVALTLVTLTFLATARLLIRDFFSMDIGLAPQFVFDFAC